MKKMKPNKVYKVLSFTKRLSNKFMQQADSIKEKAKNLEINLFKLQISKKSKADEKEKQSAKAAIEEGYMSSDSSNEDGGFSEQDQQNFHKVQNPPNTFIFNQEQQKPAAPQKKIQVQQGKQRIENLLRQNNILQNQLAYQSSGPNNYFKFSDKSSFKSFNNSDRESDKDFFNVFQSSDREGNRNNISNYSYFCQRLDDNKNFCFSQKQ